MKYYAIVTHHSIYGQKWEEMNASTITGAKRAATKEFGSGYHGHTINLVEVADADDYERINDLPTYRKIIGPCSKGWSDAN